MRPSITKSFSLVEVVIAVGIFAVAVTVMLALLPALTRQSGEAAGALEAQRLADGIRQELHRVAQSGGFDALATTVPSMSAPLANGFELVAARDGSRVHAVSYWPPGSNQQIPQAQRYYLIEVWRFAHGSLVYDAAASALPLYVRVSWPYLMPTSASPTPLADRGQLTFVVSLTR